MGARFLILLALAAGMAIFVVMRAKPTAPAASAGGAVELEDDDAGISEEERAHLDQQKTELWKIPLAGSEPPVPPRFAVVPEVNLASGKNQLCFVISEANGYFAETMTIQYWHSGPQGTDTPQTSRFAWEEAINDFIEADKPLRYCIEIVPAEIDIMGGSLGTSENWKAEITRYNRARAENPVPLPQHPARTMKVRPPIQTGKSPGRNG